MLRAGVLAVLFALFFTIHPSAAADSADYAPQTVFSFDLGVRTLVGWVPGDQVAEAYKVYGLVENATPVLLGTFVLENPASAVEGVNVASNYTAYAVSGIVGSIESPMTAAAVTTKPCVHIQDVSITVNPDCLRGIIE